MAKKADTAPKEAKVQVPKELKRRLQLVQGKLAEHYGPHVFPDDRDLIDHVAFSALAERAPVTSAKKAMRELREAFVDWNEVRVATLPELVAVLDQSRVPEAEQSAKALLQSLQATFDALYTLDVGVLGEAEPDKAKGAKKRVEKAHPTLPAGLRDHLLLLAGAHDQAPLGAVAARILSRIGFFAGDEPEAKQRAVLAGLADRAESIKLHHLLLEHGKKLCTEDDPKCARCPLAKDCDYASQPQVKSKTAARSKSAAKAKSARKARTRSAVSSSASAKGGNGVKATSSTKASASAKPSSASAAPAKPTRTKAASAAAKPKASAAKPKAGASGKPKAKSKSAQKARRAK